MGTWLIGLIDETIASVHVAGFNVQLVASDNQLLTQYERFVTDRLQLRFCKYHQMCGGRCLIALRKLLNSERILLMRSGMI